MFGTGITIDSLANDLQKDGPRLGFKVLAIKIMKPVFHLEKGKCQVLYLRYKCPVQPRLGGSLAG